MRKNKWILFAKLNGKLVGMISGSVIDGDTVKLGEVFVATEARGMALGKKLLETLISKITKYPELKKAKAKVFTTQKAALIYMKALVLKHRRQLQNTGQMEELMKRL